MTFRPPPSVIFIICIVCFQRFSIRFSSDTKTHLDIHAFGNFQVFTHNRKQKYIRPNNPFLLHGIRTSKWDNLDDEDDLFEPQGPEVPKDMRYIEFNIMRQNNHFVAIREAGGPEITNDIYARDPNSATFWFVGKVARISDVSVEKAVARQYPLIEEHAARLRPLELYPKKGSIELWTAPGDSEMDVAYNRPHVHFVKMKRGEEVEGSETVRNLEIGFQGEIYDSGEEGFRTLRTDDGLPLKEEIKQQQEEKRPPTDEEMKQISEILKGKDLNELFDNKD